MQTTLVATGMGAISGLLAWHRCRHYRPNTLALVTTGILVLVGAGAASAAASVHTAEPPTTVVVLHLLVVALPLAAVDALTGRLPRRQVLATYPSTALVLALAAIWTGPATLLHAASGAVTLWAFFLALACLGGIGAGDVRLAPILGAHLGHAGLLTVAIGTGAAFTLGAITAAGLAITGRLRTDKRVPFGPALLAGSVVALLA